MRHTLDRLEVLRRRLGFRGATLLWFASVDLVYGLSLAFPAAETRRTPTAKWFDSIMPLEAWSVLWLATAAACAVYAFRVRDRVGFAAATTLKALWGLACVGGWLYGAVDRGWVSAAIWLVMAGWVSLIAHWPEPKRREAASS